MKSAVVLEPSATWLCISFGATHCVYNTPRPRSVGARLGSETGTPVLSDLRSHRQTRGFGVVDGNGGGRLR